MFECMVLHILLSQLACSNISLTFISAGGMGRFVSHSSCSLASILGVKFTDDFRWMEFFDTCLKTSDDRDS